MSRRSLIAALSPLAAGLGPLPAALAQPAPEATEEAAPEATEEAAPEALSPEDERAALEAMEPLELEAPREEPAPITTAWTAAALLGATLPSTALEPAPSLRLELGVSPAALRGRLRPFFAAAGSSAAAEGSIEAEGLEAPYDWSLTRRSLRMELGVGLRLLPRDAAISPEVRIAPALAVVGDALEAGGGVVHEVQLTPGWAGAVGLAAAAGPGDLLVQFGASSLSTDGVISGSASGLSIDPALGYRILR